MAAGRSNVLPPGLTKRGALPPGLEKQVETKGALPPGLQKRTGVVVGSQGAAPMQRATPPQGQASRGAPAAIKVDSGAAKARKKP